MQNNQRFSGGYAPLNGFVAHVRPQMWRLFVGMALMLLIYMVSVTVFFLALEPWVLATDTIGGDPLGLILFLASFGFMALAAVLATIWPARRPIASLIGPLAAAWHSGRRTLGAAAIVLILALISSLMLDDSVRPNLGLAQVLPWLPWAIAALFVQVTAEELVFRGFIMGQLAARFASPWVWMGIPAALFGLLHYDAESYGDTAWIVCAATAIFALIASDLTARTGNLGAAIALHFANNFFAMVLLAEPGDLDGLAIYRAPVDYADPITLATVGIYLLLLWLAARLALRV